MSGANDNQPGNGPGSGGGGPKGPIRDTLRPPLPKRFYKEVMLRESPALAEGSFEVLLDGRPVRTPKKRVLVVPGEKIAQRVADEWIAQVDVIDPASMPLTRLVNSALDTVAENRAAVAAEVVAYAGSDLLCYRATNPAGLVARQEEIWDPILSGVESAIGARFVRIGGVNHAPQPEDALQRVAAALTDLPDLPLAGLQLVTTLTGSAILALAQIKGLLTADEVWAAAHLDEDWQIALWGHDEEAEARRAVQERDFRAAAAVLSALG
jgi:chaperone required for assembly of F1-ATPase